MKCANQITTITTEVSDMFYSSTARQSYAHVDQTNTSCQKNNSCCLNWSIADLSQCVRRLEDILGWDLDDTICSSGLQGDHIWQWAQHCREGECLYCWHSSRDNALVWHELFLQPVSWIWFSYVFTVKGKGKVIPLQAQCGPEGGKRYSSILPWPGTRRGWVISSMPRPHFSSGKELVPILQEAGWAPGPVWMGGKISSPPGFDPGPSNS